MLRGVPALLVLTRLKLAKGLCSCGAWEFAISETQKPRNARLFCLVGPHGLEPWTKGL